MLGARWKIDFANAGTIPLYVGWCIRRKSAVDTGNSYIESGDVAYRLVNDGDGGNGAATLMGSTNIANYLGLQPSNSDLEADITASPTEELFLHVFAFAMTSQALDPNTVDVGVTLDYTTKWREKILLAQS